MWSSWYCKRKCKIIKWLICLYAFHGHALHFGHMTGSGYTQVWSLRIFISIRVMSKFRLSTCMFLDSDRKPEHLEYRHGENMQIPHSKEWHPPPPPWRLNPGPSIASSCLEMYEWML